MADVLKKRILVIDKEGVETIYDSVNDVANKLKMLQQLISPMAKSTKKNGSIMSGRFEVFKVYYIDSNGDIIDEFYTIPNPRMNKRLVKKLEKMYMNMLLD